MRRVFVVVKWIRHLFGRKRFENEMQTEMRAHIEQEAALQMARGLNAADAMSAASAHSETSHICRSRRAIQSGGVAAARGVRVMMFGVTSVDPLAYATAVAVVCTAAFLACYFPARRATRIDPVTALRTE